MAVLDVSIEMNGNQVPVGRIEGSNSTDATFTYSEEYMKSSNARQISISLPLQKEAFSVGQTRRFFEGLLPEGFTRKSVAHYIHADETDYVTILSSLGRECLGAIRIEPQGDCSWREVEYEKLTIDRVKELAREGATKSALLVTQAHLSLTGASGKAGLYYDKANEEWYLPKGSAPSTHIVKQSHIRLDGIVLNEQLAMKTAENIGLDVPKCFIINVGHSRDEDILYATARYDRKFSDKSASVDGLTIPYRLHQEDFAQAMGISSYNKYERNREGYLRMMFDLLRNYSANPIEDQLKLWNIVIFDYLIGNTDNHLKNYSLLYDNQLKGIRLAPAYDILSTSIYKDSTRDMAFHIGDRISLDEITRSSFEAAASEVGLGTRLAMKQFDAQCQKFKTALTDAVNELSGLGFTRAESFGRRILRTSGYRRVAAK